MKARGVDRKAQPLPHACPRPRVETGVEQGARLGDERRVLHARCVEDLLRDALRVDKEEGVGVRAQLLQHGGGHVDGRKLARRKLGVLEALRPDSENDPRAVARSGAGDLERILNGGETWTVE